ncbi:MAG: hypothetical protein ACREA5_02585 [Nitrosotalea sp.]
MKTLVDCETKSMGLLFGVLALIAIVTIAPHAFAQLSYTDANNPHGPLQPVAWVAAMAVVAAMSGVGVFTAIRRSKLH